MLPALPPRRTLIENAETLLIAVAGGLGFTYLNLPAALVSGSVVTVAVAALLGRRHPGNAAAAQIVAANRPQRISHRQRHDVRAQERRDEMRVKPGLVDLQHLRDAANLHRVLVTVLIDPGRRDRRWSALRPQQHVTDPRLGVALLDRQRPDPLSSASVT